MPRASGARLGASSHFVGCLLKKPILFALLFFLAAPLAAPVAYAYDFGTAGTIAALGTAGAALALVFGAPAALGTVAIGALIAGIQFGTDPSLNQTPEAEVQLSPSAKLSTPSGWSAPASGQVEPTPPASASLAWKWRAADGFDYNSPAESCAATQAHGGYPSVCGVIVNAPPSASTCSIERKPEAGGGCFSTNTAAVSACPAGYVISGATCVLNDANAVQKPSDNRCTIKRTGNSFAVDPRDPDCLSGKIPATTAISPNVITSTKADGSTKSVTINADGSSTITESRPNNSTNTTETNTTTISAPNASGVVSVTGQGSGVAPGTGTQAGTSSPPLNINFDKSGLATEGTLGGIKSSVDAIKDGLDPGSADSSLSAQKSAFDTALDGLTSMFSAEPSKPATGLADDFSLGGYLPSQCGCIPLTITFHGQTASYDWCAPMAVFKDVLSWVLGMLTAVYVLSLFRLGGSK